MQEPLRILQFFEKQQSTSFSNVIQLLHQVSDNKSDSIIFTSKILPQ